MMKFGLVLVFLALIAVSANAFSVDDEITIFDSEGDPIAYVSEDYTIYLWDGDPVAYVYSSRDDFHIYGFNGNHLGWVENGVLRDHEGDAVGFLKGAVEMVTSIEPIKSIKSIKPIKSIREIAPIKPIMSTSWSKTSLKAFLLKGKDS